LETLDKLELLARKVKLVLQVKQVQSVTQEILVQLVILVHKAKLEILVQLARLVHKVKLEIQG
jgi:hypothetical protein